MIRAVQMATWQQQDHHAVILHSDRGSQFHSGDYQHYLSDNSMICSMSVVGHCGDNAACEVFFVLLKRERIYRTSYATLDAARTDVLTTSSDARQDQKFATLLQPSVISG